MRISLIILLIFEILFSCGKKSNKHCICTNPEGKFIINIDTINLNLKTYVNPSSLIFFSHAIDYGDKYYCFFHESFASKFLKHFFIISKDGIIEHEIIIPQKLQDSRYFDLFILKDSIFIKEAENKLTFYLDNKNLSLVEHDEVDDVIYEDNNFQVICLGFGEFGCTTWFKDKKTNKQYELDSYGPVVNKIDSNYFISSNIRVLKIEDPLRLKVSSFKSSYYKKGSFHAGSTSLVGTEMIYNDTTAPLFDDEFKHTYIETSFICKNQLLNLCVDSNSTFISKIINGKLDKVQIIGNNYRFFDDYYSYRTKIQKDNSQLLKFCAYNNKDVYGMFEICGNNINIRYLNLIK